MNAILKTSNWLSANTFYNDFLDWLVRLEPFVTDDGGSIMDAKFNLFMFLSIIPLILTISKGIVVYNLRYGDNHEKPINQKVGHDAD